MLLAACCLLFLYFCRFAESLDYSEQEWLAWEINQHLAEARGAAPTMDDMPPEEAPEVRASVVR